MSLQDYDFILHLNPKYLQTGKQSTKGSKFKNLNLNSKATHDVTNVGLDVIGEYFAEISVSLLELEGVLLLMPPISDSFVIQHYFSEVRWGIALVVSGILFLIVVGSHHLITQQFQAV